MGLASPQSTGACQVFVGVTTTLLLPVSLRVPNPPNSSLSTSSGNEPNRPFSKFDTFKGVTDFIKNVVANNPSASLRALSIAYGIPIENFNLVGNPTLSTNPGTAPAEPRQPPNKNWLTGVVQSQVVTPYFLGWGKVAPRPKINPKWRGIKGDVRGGGVNISEAPDQDDMYLGQESEVAAAEFTVWDEDVLQYIERFILFSQNGLDGYYDAGTLAIAEGQTYQLWIRYPRAYTSQYMANAKMVPGIHYWAARTGTIVRVPGTEPGSMIVTWKCLGAPISSQVIPAPNRKPTKMPNSSLSGFAAAAAQPPAVPKPANQAAAAIPDILDVQQIADLIKGALNISTGPGEPILNLGVTVPYPPSNPRVPIPAISGPTAHMVYDFDMSGVANTPVTLNPPIVPSVGAVGTTFYTAN